MTTVKAINKSHRDLFLYGGRLDILLNANRQLDEFVNKAKQSRRAEFSRHRELQQMVITECPCGCGLKNDFCDAHLATIAAREELPF